MRPSSRMLVIMTGGLVVAVLPLVWAPASVLVATLWMAVAGAIIFDVLSLKRASLSASFVVPRTALVGDPIPVVVVLRSRSRRTLEAALRFEVGSPLQPPEETTVVVSPGGTEHEHALRAPVRGEGKVQAVWIKLAGPLGAVESIERAQVPDGRIAVLPNVAALGRDLELRVVRSLSQSGHRLDLGHGEGTEFDSLQAYVAGMDTRQIDWKSSARHHALRARRYRRERDQRLVLCLDTGRLMQAPINELQRLDHAIHTAMLLSNVALRGRDLVGLHAYGASPGPWLQPATGHYQQTRLMRVCAALRPENAETNHALGLHAVLSRLSRRSLVIVFTDFTDSTMAQLMIEYLQQLARRHVVLFVALDDPVVDRPWIPTPENVEGMASAVMTAELRQARRLVLRELEIAGVRVVHGEPGEAALGVLQQYFDIKRRGLLG